MDMDRIKFPLPGEEEEEEEEEERRGEKRRGFGSLTGCALELQGLFTDI